MMGAIMAVGVGVANGNLLITFANELREDGYRLRLRPRSRPGASVSVRS